MIQKKMAWMVVSLILFTILACGGATNVAQKVPDSSGDTDPNPSDDEELTDTVGYTLSYGNIDLTWDGVAGATSYNLFFKSTKEGSYNNFKTALSQNRYTYKYIVDMTLFDLVDARIKLEACGSSNDCRTVGTTQLTGDFTGGIKYIKPFWSNKYDNFGSVLSLSADGNVLLVGAKHESSKYKGVFSDLIPLSAQDYILAHKDSERKHSGAAYVFVRTDGVWKQPFFIKAHNGKRGDNFGNSTALSSNGEYMIVGANKEDGGNPDSGATYIYHRTQYTWSRQAYVKAPVPEKNSEFGHDVSISADGSIAAVSAARINTVYIFQRVGEHWSQTATITRTNANGDFDYFGNALYLSDDGNTLAVGANYESGDAKIINGDGDNNLSNSSGAAYIFTRNGNAWTEQAYIKAPNADSGDFFGLSVALSSNGDKLAVGATHEGSNATGVNGDMDNNSALDSGAVYVYARKNGIWEYQAYIKASNSGKGASFGGSLSMSSDGNTLLIGSSTEGNNMRGINGNEHNGKFYSSGAAYLFKYHENKWSQVSYIKAKNPDKADFFGSRVSLSGDGGTLAISSPNESSYGSGGYSDYLNDNSLSQAGAVYIY